MRSLWTISRLVALSLVLAFAALQKGGVWERDWSRCLLVIGLITLCVRLEPQLTRTSRYLLIAGFSMALLQLVPLPAVLLRLLSPSRYALLRALDPVTGPAAYATLSAAPWATVEQVANLTAYLLVFLLVTDIARRFGDALWVCAWPFLTVALLEAALGLMQYHAARQNIVRGTWMNRDHYAGFLEMCLPFAVLYAVSIMRRGRQEDSVRPALEACGLLAIAAAILIAIVLTLSRMGFVATLAALFSIACVSLGASRGGWIRWTGIAGALVLALGAFIYLPTDALIARFSILATQGGISAELRNQIWRESLALIHAFPAFGCGLGAYESCFLPFKSVAPMNTVDYAHNDYLQYWAELGSIGFLLGLAFCARLFVKTLRAATNHPDTDQRYRALACVGALVAIGLHSFVDFNLSVPANAMLLAWISGIAAASAETPPRSLIVN